MNELLRKIYLSIVRLRSRGKIDRNNVGNLDAGKTDIPQYYYPHELINIMYRLEKTHEQARLLIHESIEILNKPQKIKLNDFLVEMQFEMSTRLRLRLDEYNRRCDYVCYLDDLDEKTFFSIRSAGKKTYEEFLSVVEKYYAEIGRRQNRK